MTGRSQLPCHQINPQGRNSTCREPLHRDELKHHVQWAHRGWGSWSAWSASPADIGLYSSPRPIPAGCSKWIMRSSLSGGDQTSTAASAGGEYSVIRLSSNLPDLAGRWLTGGASALSEKPMIEGDKQARLSIAFSTLLCRVWRPLARKRPSPRTTAPDFILFSMPERAGGRAMFAAAPDQGCS